MEAEQIETNSIPQASEDMEAQQITTKPFPQASKESASTASSEKILSSS